MSEARRVIDDKINQKMDFIQRQMESNQHLLGAEKLGEIEDVIESLKMYWHVMSEEDRDYIHGVQYAIENDSHWDV